MLLQVKCREGPGASLGVQGRVNSTVHRNSEASGGVGPHLEHLRKASIDGKAGLQDPSDEMLEEVGAPQVKRVKFQEGQFSGEQQRYSRIAPFTAEEQAAADMDEDELTQDGEAQEPSSPGDEPLSPSERCMSMHMLRPVPLLGVSIGFE